VAAGEAVTEAPLLLLRPVAGLQVKVEAPPAVKGVEVPLQMKVPEDTVIVGEVTMLTVTTVESEQAPVVPVTV
jgi:hypothetical protein